MPETKYGYLIKSLSFADYGPGQYRQGTKMSSKFLGYDVNIEYGAYWSAGKIGTEPFLAEKHDFDEVMLWMGTETADLGYLGAEVEFIIGEEREKHMITTSTAVAIPKGLLHLPATIGRMDKRIISMTVSVTPEWSATTVAIDRAPYQPVGHQAKYQNNVINLGFVRNGPWHYGVNNQDTHDGAITNIDGKGFEFNMSYESVRKAPYRFSPYPDRPHAHPYTEFLVFMGADCNDLSELGAEAEISMGKERERHIINKPTVVVQPQTFPHLPLTITKLYKPFIFCVIRPFGHGTGETTRLPPA